MATLVPTAFIISCIVWLMLLVATDFSGLVIGPGLLGALVATDRVA